MQEAVTEMNKLQIFARVEPIWDGRVQRVLGEIDVSEFGGFVYCRNRAVDICEA